MEQEDIRKEKDFFDLYGKLSRGKCEGSERKRK
jgi:hypothetical protein